MGEYRHTESGKDKASEQSLDAAAAITPTNHIDGAINRKYHQALVVLVANLNLISQGQSPGISGFALPQLWSEDSTDSINVSRELGAWFGKNKNMFIVFF